MRHEGFEDDARFYRNRVWGRRLKAFFKYAGIFALGFVSAIYWILR